MAKRENGSGMIYKRKYANSTKYVAYTPATYTVDEETGKVRCIRIKLGSYDKKAQAQAVLDTYRRHPTVKINYTLRQIYEEWAPHAYELLSVSSVNGWRAAWAQVCNCAALQLGDQMIREITTGQLRELIGYYAHAHQTVTRDGSSKERGPLSKSSVTKIKALLTQLYDYALENNIVDKNYAKLVKLPKLEDPTVRAMTDIEFATVLRLWQTVPGGDAVLVLCYTGFRVSEFCNLTTASYDAQNGVLIGGSKTRAGKNRIVPVHSRIRPMIERWAAGRMGPLYPAPDGQPYDKDSFRRKVWRPAILAMGLSAELNPHSARHTCATRMSANGAPAEDIRQILGHSDYSETANTYIQQSIGTLARSMEMMD